MPLIPGTQLGPYEIESLIGSGGMGEVYKAHDTRLNRTVAIKRMIRSPWCARERRWSNPCAGILAGVNSRRV
jgi:hypothetical protein